MMTSDTDDENGDAGETAATRAEENGDEESTQNEGAEPATVEDVEHTHPHTDQTFERTGVHGRGKRSGAAEDEDEET